MSHTIDTVPLIRTRARGRRPSSLLALFSMSGTVTGVLVVPPCADTDGQHETGREDSIQGHRLSRVVGHHVRSLLRRS
jgi:hypothetical protein